MKRIIGTVLIVLSIVFAAATVLWFISGLAGMPDNPSEDDRTVFSAMLLFFFVQMGLECATFLGGRYLRRNYPSVIPEQPKIPPGKLLLPLAAALGCSIAITILVFLVRKFEIKALAFLISQPWVLAQLIVGGFMGIKLGGGTVKHVTMNAVNLLYYLALFYPLFRIMTMDRKLEAARYKLMITLLGILAGVHILMGFVLAMLARA